MRIKELFESPQIVRSTDFDLGDVVKNKKEANTLLAASVEVFEDNKLFKFFRAGKDTEGTIAVVSKATARLTFVVDYVVHSLVGLPNVVTQVKIWRDAEGDVPVSVTKNTFFEILLKKHKTIVSDSEQTPDGRGFWISRISEASQSGLKVGLYRESTKSVSWFDPEEHGPSATEWAKKQGAWGTSDFFKGYRFVITS